MQVSVETTEGLERRLTIKIPAEKVGTEIEKRLKNIAKNRRIDGFRPGKAPMKLIKQKFGASITADATDELMQRHYIEAIIAEKIEPAGSPKFALTSQFDPNHDLEFTATFEVYPEIEIKDLDQIQIEKKEANIQDSDVDNMLTILRKQHGTWVAVEGNQACEKGQRVIIDFKGSTNGETFKNGEASDFSLVLGEGTMVPGFEEAIIGNKAGDTFTIHITFPEDYQSESLQGKLAQFEINLKKIEDLILPEIDSAFIKKFNIHEGTVEALRNEIRKNMERELTQALRSSLKNAVLKGLVEKNQIDVPKAAIKTQIKQLKKQAKERFGEQLKQELPDELFQDQAIERVRLSLLLEKFIRDNDIQVDQERVKTLIENIASAYEQPQEVVEHYNNDQKLLKQVQAHALEEQAIDLLLQKAQVTVVESTFSEVIHSQSK